MVCYVKNGSKGVIVKAIQVKLNSLGYYKGKIDSSSGPVTVQAIKNYQKNKRLAVDGCVGPITWKSLFGVDYPNTKKSTAATYNSDKTAFMKSLAKAISGGFNNLTGCYNLIKKNETYKFGIGDTVAQAGAVANLLKNVGNNCVDYAQLLHAVVDDLNKVAGTDYKVRYVRTYCTKDKVGHVYIEVQGGEFAKGRWTPVDGAAGASPGSKYPIGKAWCMDYPDKIYNQEYLERDDGI